MPIHVTTSTVQSLSNKTFVDYLSTTGEVYSQSGNSQQWNSTYSNVQAKSSYWITGPASATDNALVRFDGTTGKLVENSVATLTDSGNLMVIAEDARITVEGVDGFVQLDASSGGMALVWQWVSEDNPYEVKLKPDTYGPGTDHTLILPNAPGAPGQVLTINSVSLPDVSLVWRDVGYFSITGPASATDNALVRFDGTTGKLVQNSGATLQDSGDLTCLTVSARAGETSQGGGAGGDGGILVMGGGPGAGEEGDSYSGQGGNGGNVYTQGGIAFADDWLDAGFNGGNGGTINLSGGNATSDGDGRHGGSITTANGGGSINTTGKGIIELGEAGQRTTLRGSASGDNEFVLPPDRGENGQVLTTDGLGYTSWAYIPAPFPGGGIDSEVRELTGNWENTYSSFSTQSADNASVYSTVQTNSADAWNYQGTDVKSLTSNWENTYTTVNANSAQWAIDTSIDTQVRSLTSNWENTYTSFSAQSADNASVYSTVQSNSATWGTGGGSGIDSGVRELTGNWESTYSTVQSNSATWGTGGGGDPTDLSYTRWQLTGDGSLDTFSIPGASTSVEAAFRVTIDAVIQDPASYTVDSSADTIVFSSVPQLSSNIVIIETQTQASQSLTVLAAASGDWNSTYSTVQSNSATWANDSYNEIWIGAGAMISPTLSGAESTTLPITGGGNEIYVDAFNFDAASIEYAQFSFLPPTNCNRESFKCQFSWTASTTGNAAWNIQATSLDDSNAIDIAWGNAQEAIDYANDSTTFQLTTATNTISPSGTTDANSMMLFRAYRDVNSVDDTLAVDASLLGIRMQYMLNGGLSASW